jgi:hypothetical protein
MSLVRSLLKAAPQQASRRAYSAAPPFPQVNKGFVPMFSEAPIKESDIVAKYLRETAWSQERAALEGHAPGASCSSPWRGGRGWLGQRKPGRSKRRPGRGGRSSALAPRPKLETLTSESLPALSS